MLLKSNKSKSIFVFILRIYGYVAQVFSNSRVSYSPYILSALKTTTESLRYHYRDEAFQVDYKRLCRHQYTDILTLRD